MRPSIITIVLLMFLSACSPQSNQHYEKEESLISSFLIDAEVEFCILIPVEGCTTCTSHGLKFAENNIENNKIRFILTDVSSQKNTKIKVGEKLFTHPRISIDYENVFTQAEMVTYNPTILHLKAGTIIQIEETTSDNVNERLELILNLTR